VGVGNRVLLEVAELLQNNKRQKQLRGLEKAVYLFILYLFIYLSIYLFIYSFFISLFILYLFYLFIYLFIYLCIYSLFICFIYLLIYSLLPVYVLIAAPRPSLCRFFSVCWHAVANFEVTCALAC